jgi:acyl-CoA synthetase (AMP-forming)/AMP-acid ligase II
MILSESRTAHAAVAEQAHSRPGTTAIYYEDREVSFGELNAESNQIAHALVRSGIGPGSRVAYYGMDSPDYYQIALGALKAGAVFVPVNWRLSSSEADHIIRDSEAELLFTEPKFRSIVGPLAPALPGLRDVIYVGESGSGGLHAWQEGAPRSGIDPGTGPDDAAIQVYTSGTTGLPKGAVLAHRSFFAFVEAMARAGTDWFDWLPDDVSLVSFPGSSAAGLEWFMHGVMVGIPNVLMRVFTADEAVRLIERHGVTITYAAPAMLQLMLDQRGVSRQSFRSLRKVAYGAAPMPDPLLERCLDSMGCQFVQVYASTETGNVATILPPADHVPGSPLLRSVGRACPGNELRIVDEDERELPSGRIGQIWIKTPACMLEYWRQPEATKRALSDGWLRMGDAGYVDDQGYLFLADRLDDTIIVAGQNIYPAEVEAALTSHPLVAEAAVVGVPDGRWGEAVWACVVPVTGESPAERELLSHLHGRVADFKIPTRWVFATDLPRNSTGKVLRRVLRERFQTRHDSNHRLGRPYGEAAAGTGEPPGIRRRAE